jgi:hypothetical protein
VSQEKMEQACAGLHTAIDTLKGENAQLVIDHEAEVATANKKF